MKLRMKLASGLAVLSLGLVPAAGMAQGVDYAPDPPKPPKGPKAEPKGKAYGYHCKGQSKQREEGQKGTDFSLCVKALAQADKNENLHPKKACKALSKEHVKGEKGTAFSRCVKGVNEMRKEEREKEAETAT